MMRPLSGVRVLLFVASMGLAAGGAQAQNNPFGDLFKPPGAVQSEQAAANAQSESVLRIDRLENQLRTMTGQIEELQFRNQQLEQQVRKFQEDIEYRLSDGKGPKPGAAGPVPARPAAAPIGAPAVIAPGAASPGKRSDAFDPNEDPVAPGAPQPLGSPASASAGLSRPNIPLDIGPAGAPAVARSGAGPSGPQTASLAPTGSAREMFDLGYGQIQRQDYAAAEQTFRQFLQVYPSDRLTPDAVYLLGESQFQRQSYKDSAELFLQVSTKYPNATRAPEALLRLGQSLAALNEREAACATFGEIDRKYPRAASSVRQAVEREQKRAGC